MTTIVVILDMISIKNYNNLILVYIMWIAVINTLEKYEYIPLS
jgi:hypothetical protein